MCLREADGRLWKRTARAEENQETCGVRGAGSLRFQTQGAGRVVEGKTQVKQPKKCVSDLRRAGVKGH